MSRMLHARHNQRFLRRVFTPTYPFDRYRPFATRDQYEAIRARAKDLRGLRVVEINSTPRGGGVATMLHSIIPCLVGLGLDARWYAFIDDPPFFEVTKSLSEQLQGEAGTLSPDQQDLYCQVNAEVAAEIDALQADIVAIHDPQPAAAASQLRRRPPGGLIWRGHIDLAQPNPEALAFFLPLLRAYDLIVVEVAAYFLPGLPAQLQRAMPDAIDPLTLKNQLISRETAREAMAKVGMDPSRPIITQIARFDQWKNPIGVIKAYHQARKSIPGLQLAMLGTFAAQDDPTAKKVYEDVRHVVGDDPNVHLYTDPNVIGQLQVNAFQTGSDAVLLFSCREGFGIAATEAMWKCNAVIAGNVPGLREQITDGVNGFLVSTVDECAARMVETIQNRPMAQRLGHYAHQTVYQRFLLPRLINDWLEIFGEQMKSQLAKKVA